MVERGELSEGHARAVLAVPDQAERRRFARRIVAQGMSVRAAERAARWSGARTKPRTKTPVDPALAARVKAGLERLTGLEVRVAVGQDRARLRRRARARGSSPRRSSAAEGCGRENHGPEPAPYSIEMSHSAAREPSGRMQNRAALLATACSLLAMLASAGAVAAGQRAADYPSLYVTFNANDTVTVALANGSPVGTPSGAPTTISPGTYNVLIADPTFVSDIQWDLAGPGVSLVSTCSYGEEPSESWVETFAAERHLHLARRQPALDGVHVRDLGDAGRLGQQRAGAADLDDADRERVERQVVLDRHRRLADRAVRGAPLVGTVSAAGTIRLTFGGKPVGTLKAGRYTFSITDESKKSGFTVQETGRPATTVTTSPFTGKKKQTIVLGAGQWFAYPSLRRQEDVLHRHLVMPGPEAAAAQARSSRGGSSSRAAARSS